jgi:hypothetical protein
MYLITVIILGTKRRTVATMSVESDANRLLSDSILEGINKSGFIAN